MVRIIGLVLFSTDFQRNHSSTQYPRLGKSFRVGQAVRMYFMFPMIYAGVYIINKPAQAVVASVVAQKSSFVVAQNITIFVVAQGLTYLLLFVQGRHKIAACVPSKCFVKNFIIYGMFSLITKMFLS